MLWIYTGLMRGHYGMQPQPAMEMWFEGAGVMPSIIVLNTFLFKIKEIYAHHTWICHINIFITQQKPNCTVLRQPARNNRLYALPGPGFGLIMSHVFTAESQLHHLLNVSHGVHL